MFFYSGYLTEAYSQARNPLTQALKGSVGMIEKWKECVQVVDEWLGFALGALFVEETLGEGQDSKRDAEKMIQHIRDSFTANIHHVQWMDQVREHLVFEEFNFLVRSPCMLFIVRVWEFGMPEVFR